MFARNPKLDEEGKVLDSEIEENGGVLPMFVIRWDPAPIWMLASNMRWVSLLDGLLCGTDLFEMQ